MKPEEQRRCIAEFCGWKFIEHPDRVYVGRTFWTATLNGKPRGCWNSYDRTIETGIPNNRGNEYLTEFYSQHELIRQLVPDYLNDLNAMHEAEKSLTNEQQISFMGWLDQRVTSRGIDNTTWPLTHAAAAQRAEALLKTLNLWRD